LALSISCITILEPVAALGESKPTDVFASLGLLGTWSPNCSGEPSTENPRVTWKAVGDMVVHTVSFDGRMVALRDTVGSAEILDDQDVRFTAVRNGNVALTITIRLLDNRVWTLRAVGADGHVFYDQGVEVATGKPALVDERCGALIS